MKRFAPITAVALLWGCGETSTPDAPARPITLVTTATPHRGSLPLVIEAYGEAVPSANGVATLSVAQPGQVIAVPAVAGATVRAGQPIIVFAVSPTARSSFAQASGALRAAEAQRATTAQLLGQQLATRDQLLQADKAVADARGALDALRQEGAGSATITLRAPSSGIVATIPVSPGERTQPGAPLATVVRGDAVIVTVGVDPGRRSAVRVGARVTLYRLDGAGAPVAGRVVRVDAVLNPRTRQLDVDISYPAGAILPGEAMKVAIETGRAEGWLVPHEAVVLEAADKALVFQAVRGRAKAIPVVVRVSDGGQDCVIGAIDPAAPLVVTGAFQIADRDALRTAKGR